MKTAGIVAHGHESAALCFLTFCRAAGAILGPHLHPEIVMSAVPLGLSLNAWQEQDYDSVGRWLARGVRQVADSGADFYICPGNTAHIVLERIATELPIPGLHMVRAVCDEIEAKGWRRVGVVGTRWPTPGPVYTREFERRGFEKFVPDDETARQVDAAIFDGLCQGKFDEPTTQTLVKAIHSLEGHGAECVVLGCAEIPLVINEENSPLPTLDSTRLQARAAALEALSPDPLRVRDGWIVSPAHDTDIELVR